MIKFQERMKKNNILLVVRDQYDSEVLTSLKNERLRVASNFIPTDGYQQTEGSESPKSVKSGRNETSAEYCIIWR